jgi:alcohol dehydrogenase, propanol-preferring
MSTAGTRHPRVIAVDIHDDKRTTARELGAEHTVNAATEDAVSAIKALGGAHAAIVTAVSPDRVPIRVRRDGAQRHACLRRPPGPQRGRDPDLPDRAQWHHIKGSIVGTHLDLEEVFRLRVEGRTRVLSETRRLDQVNASIAEVLSESTATPRLVFTF